MLVIDLIFPKDGHQTLSKEGANGCKGVLHIKGNLKNRIFKDLTNNK